MGLHYIPQRYLRNFQIPAQPKPSVFLYELSKVCAKPVAIKKLAQVSGYFDDAVELELARNVEGPANPLIGQLILGRQISRSDRRILAKYMGVMIKRVPYQRRRGRALSPQVIAETLRDFEQWFDDSVRAGSVQQTSADTAIIQAREIMEKKHQGWIEKHTRLPWIGEEILGLIEKMSWQILTSAGPSYFIASDNPVCFDRSAGIGDPKAEIHFPLSTQTALVASWGGKPFTTAFRRVKEEGVRKINRATVFNADRMVFYHAHEEWLIQMIRNRPPSKDTR